MTKKITKLMLNGQEYEIREYQGGWQPGVNTLYYLSLDQADGVFTDGSSYNHPTNNIGITYDSQGVKNGCGYNTVAGNRVFSEPNVGENFPSQFTIMGFMQPTGSHFTSDHPMGICFSDETNNVVYGIGFTQSNSQVQFSCLQEGLARNTQSVSRGDILQWHHYALTYDGSTAIGYIDGIQVVSFNFSGMGDPSYPPLDGFSLFGRERSDHMFTNTIRGYIDEGICENKIRTAQDISDYLANFTY